MRIGLLGGTFDPVHLGHLRLAEGALKQLQLDLVLWIPAHLPPHKQMGVRAGPQDRARMVEMAIRGNPFFRLSRVDLDRPPPSYTIETLRRLRQQYPSARLFFLLGSDNGRELDRWRQIDQLRKWVRFAAVGRPGDPAADRLASDIIRLPISTPNVSSSDVRQRVRLGLEIRRLVPPAVARFIEEKGLYR